VGRGSMRAPKERFDFVHQFLKRVFIDDLHSKRVLSLANGALGVMTGATLAVSLIGQALAQARGLFAKSAIKQVDRLLSNAGVVPWDVFAPWVREVVGERREIVVAMDWTDFDADNQSTLALHLVTRHGRAMPLLWLTVDKDELKNQRNDFEDLCLSRLKALLPDGVAVTILADRGFGDVKLFEFLESLRFRYVIRFRGDIHVSAADGETRLAADWVGKGGRARMLRDAEVTATRQKVGAVVCVKAVGMKEAWHLAASDGALSAPQIITLYSKRWTIEPSFRDSKDLRFGMGMSVLRIDDPQRRDRLLLLNAFAVLLLTILGAAGESLGMDRQLRTSTAKRRVHSLFRQGCLLYDLIPNMPDQRLRPLIERYQELLAQNRTFSAAFGIA
jgi:Transposase DDE domain